MYSRSHRTFAVVFSTVGAHFQNFSLHWHINYKIFCIKDFHSINQFPSQKKKLICCFWGYHALLNRVVTSIRITLFILQLLNCSVSIYPITLGVEQKVGMNGSIQRHCSLIIEPLQKAYYKQSLQRLNEECFQVILLKCLSGGQQCSIKESSALGLAVFTRRIICKRHGRAAIFCHTNGY